MSDMSIKVANNILEFLVDPTVIPVERRLYFRPEERLQNEYYTDAKADAAKAYGTQKHNSDFYPGRNRQQFQREATVMDRKTMIASLDILAQSFAEDDPIAKDLRTMAYAVDKMGEETFTARTAKANTFKCPECGTKVLEQTGYCVKCKKKVKKAAEEKCEKCGKCPCACMGKDADQNSPTYGYSGQAPTGAPAPAAEAPAAPAKEEEEKDACIASGLGTWNKKAADVVRQALISEVIADDAGDDDDDDDDEKGEKAEKGKKEEKPAEAAPAAPEAPAAPAAAPAAPVKEATLPDPKQKKEDEKPAAAPAATPAPAAPAAPEAPAAPVQAKSTVDTSILGCEMSMPMMTAEDVGVLSSEEQSRLEGLVSGIELTAEEKQKLGLKYRF